MSPSGNCRRATATATARLASISGMSTWPGTKAKPAGPTPDALAMVTRPDHPVGWSGVTSFSDTAAPDGRGMGQ